MSKRFESIRNAGVGAHGYGLSLLSGLLLTLLLGAPCQALAGGPVKGGRFLPFSWSSYVQNGTLIEKAAILVPIVIEGSDRKLFAQLDTGADVTSFYGPALRSHGIAVDSTGDPAIKFKWYDFEGAYKTPEEHAYVRWDMGSGSDPDSHDPREHIVGTIGLDEIDGRILVLDFPGQRFAVLADSSQVSELQPAPVHYVNAELSFYKFYVQVIVGADTLDGVRYDCGSSTATLILPLESWQRVTGLSGDERVVVRDSLQSWGNYVRVWKAPANGDLCFGPIRMHSPEVMCVDWPDSTLRTMSFLGNRPFCDSCVVVVDCMNRRFGVAISR